MLRWLAFALAGLVALVAIAAIVGLFLPKGHRASRTVGYSAQPPAVFAAITDFASFPQWRTDVKSVTMLPEDGGVRFQEEGAHGTVTYRVEERTPDSRLVTRIDDPTLPFGGTWTFEVKPAAGGSELTITEDGEVYNPLFRVMSRLFFSPYDTIDTYQADLRKRLKV
jgi:Polyketide cyclase / dehydrase and lipid transport